MQRSLQGLDSGFKGLVFRGLGFRGLGFRVQGSRGFRGLGVWGIGIGLKGSQQLVLIVVGCIGFNYLIVCVANYTSRF